MSGKELTVSKTDVDSIYTATNEGARFIKISDGLIVNPATISEMFSDEQALAFNPVLNDPDWSKWIHDGDGQAADRLDKKYPLPKYEKEWEEANRNKWTLSKTS